MEFFTWGGAGFSSRFYISKWRNQSSAGGVCQPHNWTPVHHSHAHTHTYSGELHVNVFSWVSDRVCALHQYHITNLSLLQKKRREKDGRSLLAAVILNWKIEFINIFHVTSLTAGPNVSGRSTAKLSHCVCKLQASLASSPSACVNWICVQAGFAVPQMTLRCPSLKKHNRKNVHVLTRELKAQQQFHRRSQQENANPFFRRCFLWWISYERV